MNRDAKGKHSAGEPGQVRDGTLQGLVESVTDAMVAVNPAGEIAYANRRAESVFRYGNEELNGKPVLILLDESSHSVYAGLCCADGTGTRPAATQNELAINARRKDGSTFPAELHLQPVQTHGGELLVHLFRDTDDIRETRRALRDSEERYRAMVEYAPDAIVMLDLDELRFIDCNASAEELFGLSREQLLERGPIETSPATGPDGRPVEEAARDILRVLEDGKQVTFEWVHLHADGHEIPCEVRLVRFPSADRVLARGSMIDITERKQIQERLLVAHDELEKHVEERTAELRQLVNSMAGREVRMAELKDVIRKLSAQLREAGLVPVVDDPLCGESGEDGAADPAP